MIELSDNWKALILKAWEPDLEISQWLPAVVREIKATRNNAEAETALFTLFNSPLVKDDEARDVLRLRTPGILQPGYQVADDYADAAGHPKGRLRNKTLAALDAVLKERGGCIPRNRSLTLSNSCRKNR